MPRHQRATDRLYQLPLLEERFLVLDLVARRPCFDLVSLSLELLDLPLQRVFELVLLRRVAGLMDLLERRLERLNPFPDPLEAFVNLLLQLSLRHVDELCRNGRC